ncbi:alpha/beta hydrolase [Bordetella hinzii]|uniref:alpha/beta hydrolase n=1 Tax=Bordetella hinzii TaxID=103855 RepID=UPI001152E825|nr:alpha/beta fold hydrolase [Bordetella hinzii]QDJ34272.1 hypothetical protein CBR68_19100 [Bordetella hinzii]
MPDTQKYHWTESRRSGRLARVRSRAGVEMTGLHAPADGQAPLLLCLHGLSGNLGTSFVVDFLSAPELEGVHLLTVESSAHGNIAMARRGDPPRYSLGGSAFEIFDECIGDLAAWVDYAASKTRGPIILLGHSLGAAKVVRYQAETADPRVRGLVLASAADLKGAFWAMHGDASATRFMDEARAMLRRGEGRALMGEDCVVGLLKQRISAATFIDRFEDGKPSDVFDFFGRGSIRAFDDLAKVTLPLLALYGSSGEIVGGGDVARALSLLEQRAARCPAFSSAIVPGNHWYLGSEPLVAQTIAAWLAGLAS